MGGRGLEVQVSVLPGSHGEQQGCGGALHSFLQGLVGIVG